MTIRSLRLSFLALAGTLLPVVARAQQAAQTPTVVTPALDFSGVVFGNYNYRMDSASKATLGGKSPNAFTLDRAYLTFRMPAGQNGAIRVTTDVFQNTNNANNGFYQGWVVRIKYGYGQYTGLRNTFGTGSSLTGRVGILHTVVIDHEEGFWPRYLSQVGLERNNFFSSADAGLAGLLTLGNSWGEVYGTVTNGPGYTSFDKDRFKDFALRASLTPLASHEKLSPIVRSFTITPWIYKGWVGSQFQSGGAGQIGPGENGAITDGLRRDRFGLFTGIKERRITAGAEYAQRMDQGETGANTAASPVITHDSTGRLIDGFIIGRPLEWLDASRRSNFSVVARYDHFTPSTDPSSPAYAGTTPSYNYWLIGASYDITSRFVLTLDWQVQSPSGFPPPTGTNVRPTPRNSTLFVHWQATF
jgi:hypothetical protein